MRRAAFERIRFDFRTVATTMFGVPDQRHNTFVTRIIKPFTELFGFSRGLATLAVAIIAAIALLAIWYFVHLAPPRTISISAGPQDSMFWRYATNYQLRLASNHISVRILTSQGSQENLQRLIDRKVDLAFVQAGISTEVPKHIVSLGSVAYQPLLIFYRGDSNYQFLSQFKGKRLAVGGIGSGARALATSLLASNGVTSANSKFMDDEALGAAKSLLSSNADAVFLTGDSAPRQVFTNLLRTAGIRLFNFVQADAYARKVSYLNKVQFPMGSLDFGANLPSSDVNLVAPTVELLTTTKLHPALVDLIIEEGRGVHGNASLLARKGEFPKPIELDVPISEEADRYYNRGRSFTYQYLPFWLANVVNRILLVFVPAVVLLIPALRLIPVMLRWKTRLKLFRWYRALLAVERELQARVAPHHAEALMVRLDEIEGHVSKMKVPASFADQYYGLRGHIGFVRDRLSNQSTT